MEKYLQKIMGEIVHYLHQSNNDSHFNSAILIMTTTYPISDLGG